MVKDARVDVILQRVEEEIGEEITTVPSHIRRYGVNNIFTRVFAYTLGWTAEQKPVKLQATSAGSLKVAYTGAGLEVYERNPTSAADGWILISGATQNVETFSQAMSVVDIMTKNFEVYVELSHDGVTYGAKKLLRGDLNHMKSWDVSTKMVRFSNVNTDGAHNASYELVGYR